MSNLNPNNIFNSVIEQNLCVGCGACFYNTKDKKLTMQWNSEGFLTPSTDFPETHTEESLKVCPFNPFPENEVKNETNIANIFLNNAPKKHLKAGRYYNTYAGYSEEYRLESTSGGLATYIIIELLDRKIVDYVMVVKEGLNSFYEYQLISSKEEAIKSSKSKYFPTSYSSLVEKIKETDKKIAFVGIGCFIKSIRLLQYYYPELKEKIPFLIGIICGGLKSRYFTDYLAGKTNLKENNYKDPVYRIKDYNGIANDYSFGCKDSEDKLHTVKMKSLVDMWGTGLFKNNACDFCEDVTTELADISLGDAWVKPYNLDGKGTNIVITRSHLSDMLIKEGINSRNLIMDEVSIETFLQCQQSSFYHRQDALGYRMKLAKKKGNQLPPKQNDNINIPLEFKLVQKQRMRVRELSLRNWLITKNSDNYDKVMYISMEKLIFLTRIYHYVRAAKNKFKTLFK